MGKFFSTGNEQAMYLREKKAHLKESHKSTNNNGNNLVLIPSFILDSIEQYINSIYYIIINNSNSSVKILIIKKLVLKRSRSHLLLQI